MAVFTSVFSNATVSRRFSASCKGGGGEGLGQWDRWSGLCPGCWAWVLVPMQEPRVPNDPKGAVYTASRLVLALRTECLEALRHPLGPRFGHSNG